MHQARASAAKASQAVAHVKDERLARLFTVIDHVETRLNLLADNFASGFTGLRLDFVGIDGLARRAPGVESRERRRARQAAGMCCQNAVFAALHVPAPTFSCYQ